MKYVCLDCTTKYEIPEYSNPWNDGGVCDVCGQVELFYGYLFDLNHKYLMEKIKNDKK